MTDVSRTDGPAPVVWMFSGQGAQYFQMGRALYRRNGTFRHWMDRLDAVAADYVGQSVIGMLYDEARSKGQPFDELLYTHPALFMVQYAMARTLRAEGFPAPDYLLGASLGEFVAAAVAEVASVEAMLFDVIKQARLFEAHCSGGAMLVVIDDVDAFSTHPAFAHGCELAGVNFDRCFVVSGASAAILEIASQLKRQDVTHQVLPVSVAFHSSRMDAVEETFLRLFSASARRPAKIPVLSCAPSPAVTANEESERFSPAYWWRVIRQPIEFQRALTGFRRDHPQAVYLDLGPSGTMATFARYNLPPAMHERIMAIMTPLGHDDDRLERVREDLPAIMRPPLRMGSR